MSGLLRVYLDPAEIGRDGYPWAWHGARLVYEANGPPPRWEPTGVPIKDLVREQAGHRCVRCGHPYRKGEHGKGQWTPCGELCTHGEPVRLRVSDLDADEWVEAEWRILTVHHLNSVKHDCRWWNLAALCQRCHLTIQGRVVMDRPYLGEHSEWFKPYVAGFYAWSFLGEELSRDEVADRLEELLSLEHRQLALSPTARAEQSND